MRFAIFALLAALAPSASGQSGSSIDTVVVTATRFQDSKRDLPVGVSVITSEDFRQAATTNLPEILAQFGLVHVRDNAGTPNQQVDLRGFGVTGDQNTVILVDGLRVSESELVPAQLSTIPLESIERIEIVRGSGAVQYGGGASGGVINIITRRSEPGASRGYLLGRAGGYGTNEGRAGYAGMGEVFGFSLDVSKENTEGYRRNNRFKQTNVAGTLEARPGRGRVYLRFAAGDHSLQLPGALTEAQIAADPRQTSSPGNDSDRKDGTVTLGGAFNAGRHEFAADLSYRDKKATAFFLPAFYVDTRVDLKSFAPRAKLRFDAFGREHDMILGMDWEEWDYGSRSAASPATLAAPFSRRVGEQSNRAVYAQANLWVAKRTKLVAGGRAQRTREQLAEQVFPTDDRRQEHSLDAYDVAVRQGLGAGWSAYAKAGTSFRVATFDENACFFPPCAATLLEPQEAHAGELGLEYERAGVRGRLAAYDMRLEDELYFSPLQGANVNLAPTKRRGIEFEGAWRALHSLELRASIAVLEAKFRATGKDVPLVPEAIATAGVHWSFASRSRLNVNLRYVGRQRYDNDEANTFARRQPAYGLVDAKLEHRVGRFELGLEVRNLFDKDYYSYGAVNFLGTGFAAYPAPGRATYASLAYRID
jgi:iron complex outermembrane receptor protein